MPTVRDDVWVPVGLDAQFQPKSSHPVVLGGYGVAVWRGETGPLQVWEDRCPHRGMRLSFGFVKGERLACLYHGWEYAQTGQCKSIPAHPDLEPPKTICAKTYAARVHRGVAYTNLSPAARAPWPADEKSGWQPVRSIFIAATAQRVAEYLASSENVFGMAARRGDLGSFDFALPEYGQIALALQQIEPGKTALHVTCESADVGLHESLARRLVRARREMERSKEEC